MLTSPFTLVDKAAILGRLQAAGTHDPDALERIRAQLLAAARWPWGLGASLIFLGSSLIFSPVGMLGGLPVVAVGSWLIQLGKRNATAVKEGFAEFGKLPLA